MNSCKNKKKKVRKDQPKFLFNKGSAVQVELIEGDHGARELDRHMKSKLNTQPNPLIIWMRNINPNPTQKLKNFQQT